MTLGEKIRSSRIAKGLTQAEIAEDKITRNMLSAIESGKASPSLDTLYHIAEKLDLPIAYLVSDNIDASFFKRIELLESAKAEFGAKRYSGCISVIEKIGGIDDELAYMLSYSNFELGVSAAKNGAFITAEKHFSLAEKYAKSTVYDTTLIEGKLPLYLAFVKNINSPLLDFDKNAFFEMTSEIIDLEFYKYLCNDWEYEYSNPLFKMHAAAKLKIKERKYYDAIQLLAEITDSKSLYEYNAYLMYCVYGDLDYCYKQIYDFENAYKYATKRISMLEGFNS